MGSATSSWSSSVKKTLSRFQLQMCTCLEAQDSSGLVALAGFKLQFMLIQLCNQIIDTFGVTPVILFLKIKSCYLVLLIKSLMKPCLLLILWEPSPLHTKIWFQSLPISELMQIVNIWCRPLMQSYSSPVSRFWFWGFENKDYIMCLWKPPLQTGSRPAFWFPHLLFISQQCVVAQTGLCLRQIKNHRGLLKFRNSSIVHFPPSFLQQEAIKRDWLSASVTAALCWLRPKSLAALLFI